MDNIHTLLKNYKDGKISEDKILEKLETLSVENMDFANVDHHRQKRQLPLWGLPHQHHRHARARRFRGPGRAGTENGRRGPAAG